ncbi:DUF4957 domain-containing protein [uncultured Bacteroides sp.]|uniref:DUF4957 domain-containing protein n=1 Tax=uncultured Bacteroides sp. TaxID=162156 RepID=UPI002604708D|nr:DUF4957 domain-containing protein [uncultured Bacteroides sp.]
MKLNKYICLLGLATMFLTTACEDQSEELTSIEYDRLFAPINLDARIINQVNVRLSWAAVSGASSYDIEIYQNQDQSSAESENNDSKVLTYDGTPVKTVTGVTNGDIPYTVTKLESETKFTARIIARGENIPESKGSGIEFKTIAEQIFKDIDPDHVTPSQVTLQWTPGEVAQKIVLNPGNIEHLVTAEEIAAGSATIVNLTPETAYTAKLLRADGKTRGTISFETLIDLGGAIAIYPEDDFVKMLTEAEAGTAFAFFPGTYKAPNQDGKISKIIISKDVEIKGVRPNDRPIINTCFQLADGAAISFKQVILDGTNTDGSQAFDYITATTYGALVLDDCEVRNFTKGFYYVDVAATIEKITINNTLIHAIECSGGDLFDCRKGYIKAINLTNSTVWNSCKERDFIRYDDASSAFAGAAPTINVDRCTIDGVSSGARRIFYVRFKGNSINFTNNMVSNMPNCQRGFSDSGDTATPTFSNNNYFNTINLIQLDDSDKKLKIFDTKGTAFDPGYKDAAKGNFTISNEEVLYKKIGDPRWLK